MAQKFDIRYTDHVALVTLNNIKSDIKDVHALRGRLHFPAVVRKSLKKPWEFWKSVCNFSHIVLYYIRVKMSLCNYKTNRRRTA